MTKLKQIFKKLEQLKTSILMFCTGFGASLILFIGAMLILTDMNLIDSILTSLLPCTICGIWCDADSSKETENNLKES